MRIPVLTAMLVLLTLGTANAQNSRKLTSSPSPSPSTTASPLEELRDRMRDPDREYPKIIVPGYGDPHPPPMNPRTPQETQLGWGVLVFGTILLALEIGLMLKLKKGWGPEAIRVVGITLVVVAGLFLIVTGYSQEQIAPMIGLLGTIIGFLLGKTNEKEGK